jgi:hypothetical protein
VNRNLDSSTLLFVETGMLAEVGVICTRTPESIVTVEAAKDFALTLLVATTRIGFVAGTVAGAVYCPFCVIVPTPMGPVPVPPGRGVQLVG